MIHILEAIIKERNEELQKKNMTTPRATVKEGDLHESLEIDYTQCDVASSDGSDISETGGFVGFLRPCNFTGILNRMLLQIIE